MKFGVTLRLLLGLLTLLPGASTDASTATWTGSAGDGKWSTPGNWQANVPPGPDDDVSASRPSQEILLASPVSIKTLALGAGTTLKIQSSSLQIAGTFVAPDCTIRLVETS